MRRLLLFIAVILFAANSISYANETTFFGSIDTRMTSNDNLEDGQNDTNDDKNFMDTKLILGVKNSFNEHLSGVASFEAGSIIWGIDGENYPTGKNSGGGASGDGVNLETKNIYLDISVPGRAIGLKCGLMPFSVADDILAGDDAFGLKLEFGEELHGTISLIKINQESIGSRYDFNVDDPNRKENFAAFEIGRKFSDTFSANIIASYLYDRYSGAPGNEIDRNIYYYGAGVTLNLGNTTTTINFIQETGNIGDSDVAGNAPVDIDLSGYLVEAKTTIDFGRVDFTLQGLYATGDDSETADKNEGFIVPETSYKTDIAEILTRGALTDELEGDDSFAAYQYIFNLNNIYFIKGALDVQFTKKTSSTLAVIYAALPREVTIKPGGGIKAHKVGTEVDLTVSHKIYTADDQVKGLRLDFIAAVLFTGDVLDQYVSATNEIDESDSMREIGLRLVYDF